MTRMIGARPPKDERQARLGTVAPVGTTFAYRYDFGDWWGHDIEVEALLPQEAGRLYPVCLAGVGACPPEDCGGSWGFAELLEALADPDHEEHARMLTHLGRRGLRYRPPRPDSGQRVAVLHRRPPGALSRRRAARSTGERSARRRISRVQSVSRTRPFRGLDHRDLRFYAKELVEVAGVEPASSKLSAGILRAQPARRSQVVADHRPSATTPARKNFPSGPRAGPSGESLEMTPVKPVERLDRNRTRCLP
jgi:Plasmid pRiA4b ORF-3-like protein